tara:strand:- start:5000 stop:5995 length:996 start_codon:yes stop_codon:yes gene_type:complete
MWYEKLIDYGLVPEFLLRIIIRLQINNRIALSDSNTNIFELFSEGKISTNSNDANIQHYEVPVNFFTLILGSRMKYSSGLKLNPNDNLNQLEFNMLDIVSKRAKLSNNQNVLDLGCGWGSSTLYYADLFPKSQFTAVSNSQFQKEYIENEITTRQFRNVKVIRADINDLDFVDKFDRIISIEMFEHMRNWTKLLNKIEQWLNPNGRLFVHYFCHKNNFYRFEENSNSWMEKYFFSGGAMPNLNIFHEIKSPFIVENLWSESGSNYSKTLEMWLEKLKLNKNSILNLDFNDSNLNPKTFYNRWMVFILACSELFNINNGNEYLIGHALLKRN